MKIDTSLASLNIKKTLSKSDFNNLSSDDKALKEQTDKFESIFIKQMLDQAMKPKSGLLPKGTGSNIYASMYTQALSDKMSGSVGLSEMIFNYLKQQVK